MRVYQKYVNDGSDKNKWMLVLEADEVYHVIRRMSNPLNDSDFQEIEQIVYNVIDVCKRESEAVIRILGVEC
jgi:hypothetical protein